MVIINIFLHVGSYLNKRIIMNPNTTYFRQGMMFMLRVTVLLQWSTNGKNLSWLNIIGYFESLENTKTRGLFIWTVKELYERNIPIILILLQGWCRSMGHNLNVLSWINIVTGVKGMCVKSNSFTTMKYQREKYELIEHYRVLGIFRKY